MNKVNKYALHLLFAAIFLIPISTALLNIFFVLFILMTVLNTSITYTIKETWKNPISRYAIFLFIFFIVGTTWSIGQSTEIAESLNKYSKFLFITLIIPYFRSNEITKKAIHSILYSSSIILFLIYLTYLNIISHNFIAEATGFRFTVDGGFKTHIINSIIMTFSGYILLNRYLSSTNKNQLDLIGSILFFHYTLFISTGTTGQVLSILMISVSLIQYLNITSVIAVPSIISLIFMYGFSSNTTFHQAKNRIEQATNNYQTQSTTGSVSTRLHQFLSSIELIKQRPLLGYGTGGTREAFMHHLPEDTVINRRDIYHPHSEYPLIAIQLGVTGLLAFIGLLLYQLVLSKQITDPETRNLSVGFSIFVLTNCLGNPFIYMSGEGHFWAIFTAALFASLSIHKAESTQKPYSSHNNIINNEQPTH